jgi:hypothetical protein
MKRRLFRILNFVALNILFFALYLNFVHSDHNNNFSAENNKSNNTQGAVLVSNPSEYLEKGPLNPGVQDRKHIALK